MGEIQRNTSKNRPAHYKPHRPGSKLVMNTDTEFLDSGFAALESVMTGPESRMPSTQESVKDSFINNYQ
jgi:hypothetical protein